MPEVWIIDPESRILQLYTSGNVKVVFNVENNVVQNKLFPELKFQLEWLWDDKYDPIVCINEFLKISNRQLIPYKNAKYAILYHLIIMRFFYKNRYTLAVYGLSLPQFGQKTSVERTFAPQ